ncbi:MAG: hypothetical protein ACI9FU_000964 [Granulosicoccus sp.]|jgi:hypothetical protein
MDISLGAFMGNQLSYSGANNPRWIVRKTDRLTEEQKQQTSSVIGNQASLIEYKANRQPSGL